MGIFRLFSNTNDDRNPNPNSFIVRRCIKIGECWVSKIYYPNCTNFEGEKILITTFDPKKVNNLDPHFKDETSLVARFVPTEIGWKMAIKTAKMINKPE